MEVTPIKLEKPIADAISRVRFAPRSNRLLISSWDSLLRLYDADESFLRSEASSGGAALLDCCFEDENSAFAACSDGCIRRFEFCTGVQDLVSMHDDAATCVEYSVETGLLISAGLDKKLSFRDHHMPGCETGCSIMTCLDIEFLSLCSFYLITAAGRFVNIYDLRNLKGPVQSKESSLEYQITCIRSFSSSEGYVVGGIDGYVAIEFFDPIKAKELSSVFRCRPLLKDNRENLVRVNDIGFHPSRDTFVTGDNDGHAIMWDAQSKKRLLQFPRYRNSVSSLSYNNDGRKLAVATSYTYQEANELEEPPEIFIYAAEDLTSSK